MFSQTLGLIAITITLLIVVLITLINTAQMRHYVDAKAKQTLIHQQTNAIKQTIIEEQIGYLVDHISAALYEISVDRQSEAQDDLQQSYHIIDTLRDLTRQ